jgi:hypothetical protein
MISRNSGGMVQTGRNISMLTVIVFAKANPGSTQQAL